MRGVTRRQLSISGIASGIRLTRSWDGVGRGCGALQCNRWGATVPAPPDLENDTTRYNSLAPFTPLYWSGAAIDLTPFYGRVAFVNGPTVVYRFARDALGRTTYEYDPADTINIYQSYRYNAAGTLTGRTNRRGQQIAYTYNAAHRLTGKSGTNVVSATYAYDTVGHRVVVGNAVETDAVLTAPSGLVDSVVTHIAGDRFVRRYQADTALRLDTAIVTSNTSIAFTTRQFGYDATLGLLDTVRFNSRAGLTSTFAYDNQLRGLGTTFPSGSTYALSDSMTAFGQHYREDLHGNTLIDTSMNTKAGFDSAERINDLIWVSASGAGYGIWQYRYDGLGRLRAEVTDDSIAYSSLGSTCPSDTTGGYQCTAVAATDTMACGSGRQPRGRDDRGRGGQWDGYRGESHDVASRCEPHIR